MGKVVSSIANVFTGADQTRAAGEQAAAQQRAAAQGAAFRPVGMTTRFGSSQFTRAIDPASGLPYISEAGYTAAPELQALQNQLFGQFGGAADFANQQAAQFGALSPAAQRAFGLGEQYMATSPEQAAQDFMRTQQAILAPQREQSLSGIRNQLFQTGRGGLATGGTTAGNMQQTNPELAAYYNALAQQDLQLAGQAEQAAQQRINFGTGLFGTGAGFLGTQAQGVTGAFSPLQTQLGLSGQVEQMAQMPYQLGIQLGTAQQPGQQAGVQGLMQASQTQLGATQAANAANAQFWGGLIGATGTAAAGGAFSSAAPVLLAGSDINIKQNIKLISKTKGGHNLYSFEYKPEFKDKEGHGSFIGVMAQEVEKVIPEAVVLSKDGYKMVNYSLIV
jgi:hypothetical protein